MDIEAIHKETGAYWDECAEWYTGGKTEEAETIAFLRSGGSYLSENERGILGDLTPWCKRAIHLQCSIGLDALSLLNHGAAEVVGVDISEPLLASARRKAEALNARTTWYCCDILQTPDLLNETADLVYTGKGAICWMMDLAAWAKVVARLLVPGGKLFLHDEHPLDWVWETKATEFTFDQEHGNYFSEKLREGMFYRKSIAVPRSHQWTVSQIINIIIAAGLTIDLFNEYPEPFWDQFPDIPPETLHRLPHTFTVLAHK